MKKIFLLLSILLLSGVNLFSGIQNIKYNTNGFEFTYIPSDFIKFDIESGYSETFEFAVPEPGAYEIRPMSIHYSNDGNHQTQRIREFFEVTGHGVRRRLNIANLRIISSDGTCELDSIRLKVVFSVNVPALNPDPKEATIFSPVINKRHIESLKMQSVDGEHGSLQNSSWYQPRKKYVLIRTNDFKPVMAQFSEILNAVPEWLGQNPDDARLIYRGNTYPVFIADNDGVVGAEDKIYFMGRTSKKDSLLDYMYTDDESFFLTFDEELPANFLTEGKSPGSTEYTSVEYDKSLGELRVFINGAFLNAENYSSFATKGEDYYIKIITPGQYSASRLEEHLDFIPDLNHQNEVEVKYTTIDDSLLVINKRWECRYKNDFSFNGKLMGSQQFAKARDTSFRAVMPAEELLYGFNKFTVSTFGVTENSTGRIGIRDFAYKGKALPMARFDKEMFSLDAAGSGFVSIPGFTSPEITSIDTLRDVIYFPSSLRGYSYAAGVKSGDNPFTTIISGNERYYSDSSGLHILVVNPDNGSRRKFFKNDGPGFTEFISGIPDNALVISTFNGTGNLWQQAINAFNQLGAKNAEWASGSTPWSFAAVKGTSNSEEVTNPNSVANIYGFFENNSGNTFRAIQPVPAGYSDIIASAGVALASGEVFAVSQSDLTDLTNSAEVLYIAHNSLLDGTRRLAEMRAGQTGLTYKIVDPEDIYKEFNYGRKSAYAIKSYLQYLYDNLEEPPIYTVLIGDANWDGRNIIKPVLSKNQVPSFGKPVSDFWYTLLDPSNDLNSDMVISRIPASTNEILNNYIDKLVEYDEHPKNPWMKNFLFLTGGTSEGENNLFFRQVGDYFAENIMLPELCADTSYVRKKAGGEPGSVTESAEIKQKINSGAIWTFYIGHAAAEVFEMQGWDPDQLNNKSRYGFLSTISCNTGAFAEPNLENCKNELYLLAKDRGMIATFGATTSGFLGQHRRINQDMVFGMADTNHKLRYAGDIFHFGREEFKVSFKYSDSINIATKFQYTMLGDPLIRIRIDDKPDLYMLESDLTALNQDGEGRFMEDDEFVKISGIINNYGYCAKNPQRLKLTRRYENRVDSIFIDFGEICYNSQFEFTLPVSDMPGTHSITIEADYGNNVDESDESNNSISFGINVFREGLLPVDPQVNWSMPLNNPVFRFIEPLSSPGESDYYFMIAKNSDTLTAPLLSAQSGTNPEIKVDENFLEWAPEIGLEANKTYYISARGINRTTGKFGAWLTIPFTTPAGAPENTIKWIQDSKENIRVIKSKNITFDYSAGTKIYLKHNDVDFSLVSRTLLGDSIKPEFKMEVGESSYITQYQNGFHILTYGIDADSIKVRKRHYNTWGNDSAHNGNYDADTTTVQLVRFLKDSLAPDEYVLIITTGPSFWLFSRYQNYPNRVDSTGNWDNFQNALANIGANAFEPVIFEDDNDYGLYISYLAKGWLGGSGNSTEEKIDTNYQRVTLDGQLRTYHKTGYFETERIGPAKQWQSLEISGKSEDATVNFGIKIFGINKNGQESLLKEAENKFDFDISDIDAKEFPYLFLRYEFERDISSLNAIKTTGETFISGYSVDYLPYPELALVKSKTGLKEEGLLRGYDLELSTTVRNISPRFSTEPFEMQIDILNNGVHSDKREVLIGGLAPDSVFTKNIIFSTNDLANENLISIKGNYGGKASEFYSFNNDMEIDFVVATDTVQPEIELRIDGRRHEYGDYISVRPNFEIILRDNSPLPFNEEDKLTVRVNGYLHPFQRTSVYNYEFPESGEVKARFSFVPDTIEFSDISIIVYAEDAEGNRDTLETFARASLINAFVENLQSRPNPVIQDADIAFDYRAPLHGGKALLNIYNFTGNKINEIEQELIIGENRVYFSGRDSGGSSLPSGVYYFRLEVIGGYYVEPVTGKFVIIR